MHVDRSISEWEARLGEQVRAARLERGLDQETVAFLAGVARRSVSALERGQGSSLRTLIAVLRALELDSWLDSLSPTQGFSPLAMLDARAADGVRQRAPRRSAAERDAARRASETT